MHNDCFKTISFGGLNQNRLLRELTDADLLSVFEGTGYTISDHVKTQLRDPRLKAFEYNTLNDVKQIINKGEFFDAGDGGVVKIYRGVSVIMNPKTKNIITIRSGRRAS